MIFIEENAFENTICESLYLPTWPQCVNTRISRDLVGKSFIGKENVKKQLYKKKHVQSVVSMDQSRNASSQWETSLQCNDVSHWLGAYLDRLDWSLRLLDCSIVPTCAAWGSAKWDYQRPLKTVGIPTVRHQPAGPIMPFKRKFRIVCCMGGVAAIMGMAVSLK